MQTGFVHKHTFIESNFPQHFAVKCRTYFVLYENTLKCGHVATFVLLFDKFGGGCGACMSVLSYCHSV